MIAINPKPKKPSSTSSAPLQIRTKGGFVPAQPVKPQSSGGGRGGRPTGASKPKPQTRPSAQPARAVQRSNPPRPQGNLLNDLKYELGNPNSQTRRIGAKIIGESVKDAAKGLIPALNPQWVTKSYVGRNLSAGLTTNVANFSRLAYGHAQKLTGQQVDPTAGPVGAFIDSAEEGGYRALGMKPPSQMTQDELGRHQLRSDLTGALLTAALLRKAPMLSGARAMQATTTLGKVGYGGIAAAGQEVANSVFSDPTGGNLSNAVNYYAGADIAPLAVEPGKDDWVTAFWKSIPTNAVGGEVLGAGAGAAVRGGQLAGRTLRDLGVPMGNTKGLARRARGAAQEASERERQVAGGLLQQDPESGAHGFTPEAMGQQPSPAPDAPEPTTPRTEMAPEADPAFNPWTDFDPGLPTSTTLGKALDDLTDEQLGMLRDNQGASVPEGVEDLLAAQERAPAMPPMPAQVLDASLLPEDYVASLGNKFRGFADGDKAFDPRPLFDPDTNPEIWKRAEALTGKSDPAELTPTDMADTLEGMLADGQAVIPSRQGAELMDVAGIRRPVSDAAPVEDAAADPWSQPNNALPDQTRWDPRQEGAIRIQDNPDGTVSVVDGAQRLGLAERLGVRQVPVTREAPATDAPTPDAPEAPARIELTPDERAQIKRDLLMRAAQAGEIRPPDAPVPAFSDPALQNLGKVDLDKPIEAGSPEAQALADEARIAVETMREQNEFAQGMKDAQRDAEGYEKLTWAEKMAKGVTGGWEAPPPARAAAPAPGVPQAPVKPVQVKLSGGGDQPPFTLPPGLAGAKPRYGSRQVRFGSDLDKVAYMLLADRSKGASKSAAAYRQALEEAGLDVGSVVNHGLAVKKALKSSKAAGDGVIDLPQQTWSGARLDDTLDSVTPQAGGPPLNRIANGTYNNLTPDQYAKREQLVSAIIKQVAGKEAAIEFVDVYERKIIPPEHGGDGKKMGEKRGTYNPRHDLITIYGMLDADVSDLELATAAFHESFHRLQFLGFGAKELAALNGTMARLRAHFASKPLPGTYIEQTPNAFMLYGRKITAGKAFVWFGKAVREGENPVLSLFGVRDIGELSTVKAQGDANFIVQGFVRMYDRLERIVNDLRGRGAISTRELYDRSIRGEYGLKADDASIDLKKITADSQQILQQKAASGDKISLMALNSLMAKDGKLPRVDADLFEDWRKAMLSRGPKSWKAKTAIGGLVGGSNKIDSQTLLLSSFGDYLKDRRDRSLAQIEDIRNNARKGGCI